MKSVYDQVHRRVDSLIWHQIQDQSLYKIRTLITGPAWVPVRDRVRRSVWNPVIDQVWEDSR